MDWFKQPHNFIAAALAILLGTLAAMFALMFSVNVPIHDHWWESSQVALATARGNFDLSLVTGRTYEHHFVFPNIVTVLNTLLTNWNLRYEVAFNLVLVALNAVCLMTIAKRVDEKHLWVYILFIGLMIFSFRTRVSWLWSLTIAHYTSYLCFYAGLYVLQARPKAWKTLLALALCSVVAVYSFAAGITVVLILTLALPLYGYRKLLHLLAWLVISAVIVLPTLLNQPGLGGSLTLSPQLIEISLALFGANFIPEDTINRLLAVSVMAIALILTLTSTHYLIAHRARGDFNKLLPLGLIALFGLVNYALILYGRADRGLDYVASIAWYAMLTAPIWIGLLGGTLYVTIRALRARTWHFYSNTVLLICLLGFYVYAGFTSAERRGFFSEGELDCIGHYPLSRDYSCVNPRWLNTEFTLRGQGDLLAWEGIALYAEGKYNSPLGAAPAQSYEWGIIDLPLAWQHLHLSQRLNTNTPDDQIIHLYDADVPEAVPPLPYDPDWALSVTERNSQAPDAILTENLSDTLWYVTTADYQASDVGQPFVDWLRENGYYPRAAFNQNHQPANIGFIHYERLPAIYRYDDALTLHQWHLDDVNSTPCEVKRIAQVWRSHAVQPADYDLYLAFLLTDEAGREVSRVEASIPDDWQPGTLYDLTLDLSLPCELASGTYNLLATVYAYDPATATFIGNLAVNPPTSGYLTTLTVQD